MLAVVKRSLCQLPASVAIFIQSEIIDIVFLRCFQEWAVSYVNVETFVKSEHISLILNLCLATRKEKNISAIDFLDG